MSIGSSASNEATNLPLAGSSPTTAKRWSVLGIAIAITAIGMMGYACVFPLLNLFIKDLGISRTQGGLLSGFWYLPGILVALPAGWAFDRYPIRRVLSACWAFIVVGVAVMTVAPNFVMLCAGRLLFSVGMNAHMVGAPKLVASWFAGRKELGFAMGLYTLAFTAGVFLSLNLLGSIGSSHGWRSALGVLTGLSVVGAMLIVFVPNPPVAEHRANGNAGSGLQPFRLPLGAWVLGLAYFGFNIGTDGYFTFAPDYLVQRGYQLAAASSIVGAYGIVAFVLKPLLSGFLNPRTAVPYAVVATLLALVSMTMLFMPAIPPLASSATLGVAMALGMPAFLALPSFLLPPEQSGQGYGLYQLFYSFGFFAQPLVGLLVDRTGNYATGFWLVAGYTVLGAVCVLPVVRRMGRTQAIS